LSGTGFVFDFSVVVRTGFYFSDFQSWYYVVHKPKTALLDFYADVLGRPPNRRIHEQNVHPLPDGIRRNAEATRSHKARALAAEGRRVCHQQEDALVLIQKST